MNRPGVLVEAIRGHEAGQSASRQLHRGLTRSNTPRFAAYNAKLPVFSDQNIPTLPRGLSILNAQIIACRLCPRLVQHREEIGQIKRRAYRDQTYWSRPITGFGDPLARVLIIGLAPGAHGANRTGRVFTGDSSGEYLYRALAETGFANQPTSTSVADGLRLSDAYIACPVRCVPPDNKPLPEEIVACRPYLLRELKLLKNVQVVVALGGIALDAYLSLLLETGKIETRVPFVFGHGRTFITHPNGPTVLCSYHPSQQNTSTKRLTAAMLRDIFLQARYLIETSARFESGENQLK